MQIHRFKLTSVSPYSQSRHYDVPKLDREIARDYEARTWRNRMHTTPDGRVFIPPTAFKNALSDAAKYLSIQIPGKGKSTYTKHIEAGVMVIDPLELPVKASAVDGEWLFVPSDGIRGSGKRVDKCFPVIPSWAGEIDVHILDEIVTSDVLSTVFEAAGKLIGIGRFRPRNNGFYGRFQAELI
jgi:hypothetical protein